MRIALVWFWERASEIMPFWRDGLRAALEFIEKDHEVVWFLDKRVPLRKEQFDFILLWGDSNCPFFPEFEKYEAKKGICLSSDNALNIDNLKKLNVTFVESQPVYDKVSPHVRTIKAFGTDTEFFTPDPSIKKDIKYFYPATFSPWKRQSAIAHLGKDLLCVGTLQPDGQKELDAVVESGCHVEVGYFPAEKIRDYYNRTRFVEIPAIHGSERTVLETMSMDTWPEVNKENMKANYYIKEFLVSGLKCPRDFVVKNYSAQIYANQLLKGMSYD